MCVSVCVSVKSEKCSEGGVHVMFLRVFGVVLVGE